MIGRCLLLNKRPDRGEMLSDNSIYEEEYVWKPNLEHDREEVCSKEENEDSLVLVQADLFQIPILRSTLGN